MHELHRSWGTRIKNRRQALSMTQVSFATLVGITQSTVSKIERGDHCPSDAMKWRIAGVLRLTVEELFPYPAVVPPFPEKVA